MPWCHVAKANRRQEAVHQIQPQNAALKLVLKLGFAQEGRWREADFWGAGSRVAVVCAAPPGPIR
ncbi:hypothetical protein ATSB10_04040 [Dyella thiooxydans]|uniref:Uncharacterized protein n=1 Tax=Dyella thiooxydans TaxID=445710 RepID=A0A160MYH9_9GAMM|nr:hypothetical protein ATSB10_04040 [Dyella thiooxydans]